MNVFLHGIPKTNRHKALDKICLNIVWLLGIGLLLWLIVFLSPWFLGEAILLGLLGLICFDRLVLRPVSKNLFKSNPSIKQSTAFFLCLWMVGLAFTILAPFI